MRPSRRPGQLGAPLNGAGPLTDAPPGTIFNPANVWRGAQQLPAGLAPPIPWFGIPTPIIPDFSLGTGVLPHPIIPAQFVIPTVDEPAPLEDTSPLPEQIDRRDIPMTREELLARLNMPGITFEEIQSIRQKLAQMGVTGGLPAVTGVIEAEEDDMGILGDIGGAIGTAVDIYTDVDRALGGWLPGGVDPWAVGPGRGDPTQFVDTTVVNGTPSNGGNGTVTPTYNGCAPGEDPMRGMVYKRVCGQWKWVKKKSRRRKQLFTTRDASQLSSLLGIAGKSEIAKTWIASHPS